MLSLETSGCKYSINRCYNVVNWFVETYLPRHKLNIRIHHRGMIRDNVYAWVSVADSDWRPRTFDIEIHNRVSPVEYISTLLHELWHVYQHVMGDLKDKRGERHWKGINHSLTDYKDQPWEIEAHRMEEILFLEFSDFILST